MQLSHYNPADLRNKCFIDFFLFLLCMTKQWFESKTMCPIPFTSRLPPRGSHIIFLFIHEVCCVDKIQQHTLGHSNAITYACWAMGAQILSCLVTSYLCLLFFTQSLKFYLHLFSKWLYQGSDTWKDKNRFRKLANASLELCKLYMEISSSTSSRKELFTAEMHLKNITKQARALLRKKKSWKKSFMFYLISLFHHMLPIL